jgi:hypothetical protein
LGWWRVLALVGCSGCVYSLKRAHAGTSSVWRREVGNLALTGQQLRLPAERCS